LAAGKMSDCDELIILTDEDFEVDPEARGWADPLHNAVGRLRAVKLDPAIVEAQMGRFVGIVGQVQLIAGGEAGAEAGITLKFKRVSKEKA
jgi:hypothetical protein